MGTDRTTSPKELAGFRWHVRHPDEPAKADLLAFPGLQGPGNSISILNCEIRDCESHGIRVSSASNVRIMNTTIRGCGGNGVTMHGVKGLRMEGCLLQGNGVPVDGVLSADRWRHAQILVGDTRPHPPDPPGSDPEMVPGATCAGVNIVGCWFDGRGSTGLPRAPVGVAVSPARGTVVMGCRFEGHLQGAAGAPIWIEEAAKATILLGNSTFGESPIVNRSEDPKAYDYDADLRPLPGRG